MDLYQKQQGKIIRSVCLRSSFLLIYWAATDTKLNPSRRKTATSFKSCHYMAYRFNKKYREYHIGIPPIKFRASYCFSALSTRWVKNGKNLFVYINKGFTTKISCSPIRQKIMVSRKRAKGKARKAVVKTSNSGVELAAESTLSNQVGAELIDVD